MNIRSCEAMFETIKITVATLENEKNLTKQPIGSNQITIELLLMLRVTVLITGHNTALKSSRLTQSEVIVHITKLICIQNKSVMSSRK